MFKEPDMMKQIMGTLETVSYGKLKRNTVQLQKKNPTINISETKLKHYTNNTMLFSYRKASIKQKYNRRENSI